jgi:hypothetical protein
MLKEGLYIFVIFLPSWFPRHIWFKLWGMEFVFEKKVIVIFTKIFVVLLPYHFRLEHVFYFIYSANCMSWKNFIKHIQSKLEATVSFYFILSQSYSQISEHKNMKSQKRFFKNEMNV